MNLLTLATGMVTRLGALAAGTVARLGAFAEGVVTEDLYEKIDLSKHVTPEMVSGVLDQTAGMLPVLLPASITYLGFRKALGFTFQMLRMA